MERMALLLAGIAALGLAVVATYAPPVLPGTPEVFLLERAAVGVGTLVVYVVVSVGKNEDVGPEPG